MTSAGTKQDDDKMPRHDPPRPTDSVPIGDPPTHDPVPPPDSTPDADQEHEGATEEQVGDRTGPGAGYDDELPATPATSE